MKIYFAGAIRGGRDDAELYLQIIRHLKKFGTVLTEHVGDSVLSADGQKEFSDKYIHDRDMEWLLSSDVIIAEVTKPSLGVGYEIARAIENGKKVLCLYRKQEGKSLSAMISGSDQVINKEYSVLSDAEDIINNFFINHYTNVYRNVTFAVVNSLEKVFATGRKICTRGYEQTENLSQSLLIEKPNERVLVLPHRNNNIFITIAETMWVLGGRDDMMYLSYYLPRAIDYSDDGKIWRGAYGPRLRNWKGTDQFEEVSKLLNNDRNTKRAVMSIFNPREDYVESKDIPCNNWLNFIIRDNKLVLNVAVRANDIIWGFSGINSFEWSVLQEIMAYWTSSSIGHLGWFVSSMHVYKQHYSMAKKLVESFKGKTLYDFGFENAKFSTVFSEFDDELNNWFEIETKIRSNEKKVEKELFKIKDHFLKNSLEMLYIYNQFLKNEPEKRIANLVEQLPANDFKIAAIEFFSRKYKSRNLIQLTEKENNFFQFYWENKNQ
ncbi:MAG: hypothetical protein GY749_35295 [Desulfobacteraceae bacterium]|nr:hypothetical protein [Desulfobacteraceae bacterium]